MNPQEPAPLRPVSDEHRHADYELEPNELAACPTPWCNHSEPPYTWQGQDDLHTVICAECQVEGPYKHSEAEAIAAWNQRASLAARPAKGDELLERLTRREKKRVRYGGPATARDYHSVLVNPDGFDAVMEIERLRLEVAALTQAPRSCCAEERESPVCQVPPAGWYCTRDAGHDGPCAARPIDPLVNVIRHWLMSEDHPVSKWEIAFATAIRSNSHDG